MSDIEATIRCDCGCCVLVIDYWKPSASDAHEGWFDVYTTTGAGGFRYRLGVAWRVLMGKNPWVDALVFGPKQVAQLRDFLDRCAQ